MQPTASRPFDPASSWPWRLALAGLLAMAAFLRLYHLETPSMWWDEIIVPLTARFPLAYILDFSRHCEMHPPLYHFFVKLVEIVGLSDASLRLPSAACGIALVYAAWRGLGRLYGRGVGLVAAAFLAGCARARSSPPRTTARPHSRQPTSVPWRFSSAACDWSRRSVASLKKYDVVCQMSCVLFVDATRKRRQRRQSHAHTRHTR